MAGIGESGAPGASSRHARTIVVATGSSSTPARRRWTRAPAAIQSWWVSACCALALGAAAQAQSGPPVVGITGPEGGPFPTQQVSVTLQNPHSQPITWFGVQDEPWIVFSRKKGVLQPGASGTLKAWVDQAQAAALPVGEYDARVLYRHPVTQMRVTMVIFRLTVATANYSLTVTPASSFDAAGPVGGPFTPASFSYTLQNTGNVPFDWSTGSSAPWVAAQSPTSGVLAPGQSTAVDVALNANLAGALPAGQHSATISFRRAATGAVVATRTVNLDAQAPTSGWTDFQPSADTRTVYVSASGNDSNNGLTPSTPKRTISAGRALMRNGFPDWLLLKRGDVFDEPIGHWKTSGRSASEPQLISSYGSGSTRPLLRTGASDGMIALQAGGSGPQINHIAVVGLELWAHTYTGSGAPSGIAWLIDSTNLLVEDCKIRGYQINICVPGWGGRKRELKIRRNVLTDAISTSGTVGHALYMENCDNLLIEENVIDRNGWNPAIPGAVPSIYRHGIYIQSGSGACTGVVVRGNIIANSASHGLHLRPGGVAENNLFVRNSIALNLGGGNDPSAGGVTVVAKGNVILDGKDIDAANPRGWGIEMANVASGQVSYNIIANQTLGHFQVPFTLTGSTAGIGVHNTVIERNVVWGWGGSAVIDGSGSQITNVMLRYNDINQNVSSDQIIDHLVSSNANGFDSIGNRFRSLASTNAWMRVGPNNLSLAGWGSIVGDSGSTTLPLNPYPDPGRTLASYSQSIGGQASHDDFMAQARLQSRANWRSQYTAASAIAYFRAGFGMVVP